MIVALHQWRSGWVSSFLGIICLRILQVLDRKGSAHQSKAMNGTKIVVEGSKIKESALDGNITAWSTTPRGKGGGTTSEKGSEFKSKPIRAHWEEDW